MTIRPLLALMLLPLVAACEAPATLSPDFGDAVRFNKAAQIVNPDPRIGIENTQNGDVSNSAFERYRVGKVKKPVAAPSSTVGGGK